ncbi:hypothetical protein BC939DRAFT_466734 [Gamsiella multidivaricata]|uniref:uncharacterized protein n=1 Tax=Gamsiella multidivaricata TaxID=101098 RepID=UPI00221E9D1D|nr:uncharacterized protein BC939DRAFT_466734 [Gamsiella multidivaricata]KAI7817184.1 hypothetical protein BC939DRAFT_466734 [Gamsiella multidivaricata]
MEHPVQEISSVIKGLTQGSPAEQKHVLETYFTTDAAFQHPFCHVPSFSNVSVPLVGVVDSRWVIWMIYRWYKILSPRIALKVHAAVLDQRQQILYVQISQVFSLWFVPFYKSHVQLVSALHLSRTSDDSKYYIHKQEDLYQVNEFVKFVWPYGDIVLTIWQCFMALLCVVGALLLAPLTWAGEMIAQKK